MDGGLVWVKWEFFGQEAEVIGRYLGDDGDECIVVTEMLDGEPNEPFHIPQDMIIEWYDLEVI